MADADRPVMRNSPVEDVITQSEATAPQASEIRRTEFTNENGKHFEEDYIPFADTYADDENRPCKTTSASKEGQRRRRMRSASETRLLHNAKIKREMARARKAANDAHSHSTFSLYGSCDDALVKDLKIPIYAINTVCPSEQDIIDRGVTRFTGQITVRPHLEAMEYALDEYNGRRKIPGRMAFWVDGSRSPNGVSGTAVAFRAKPRLVGSKWTVRAYTVLEFDRLGTTHTEALAIMHALRIALVEAVRNDGTDAKASDVVIFSDCAPALHALEHFTNEGQCWGRSLLARIATLANELSILDIKVQLHWVPAHKGIPGNYLADFLAKRAARRNFQERRYLSLGREYSKFSICV